VRSGWDRRLKRNEPAMPALQDAIDEAFNARIGDVSGRGKLGIDMREIWTMQPRFEKRVGNAPYALLDQPRFRAGFDFLRLRGQIGEIDPALAEWWEKFSTAYDDERHDMIEAIRESQLKKPHAPRVRVKRVDAKAATPENASPAASDAQGFPAAEGEAAPAKKRRRRRKPAGSAGSGSAEGGSEAPHHSSSGSDS
jgi:poly(A) polymerase